jgi:hypothetical protein
MPILPKFPVLTTIPTAIGQYSRQKLLRFLGMSRFVAIRSGEVVECRASTRFWFSEYIPNPMRCPHSKALWSAAARRSFGCGAASLCWITSLIQSGVEPPHSKALWSAAARRSFGFGQRPCAGLRPSSKAVSSPRTPKAPFFCLTTQRPRGLMALNCDFAFWLHHGGGSWFPKHHRPGQRGRRADRTFGADACVTSLRAHSSQAALLEHCRPEASCVPHPNSSKQQPAALTTGRAPRAVGF